MAPRTRPAVKALRSAKAYLEGIYNPEDNALYELRDEIDEALSALEAAPEPTPVQPVADDAGLFDVLGANSWDLRCFDIPTGAGDADIGWRVIGHWMAEPKERTIAEVYHDSPVDAVKAAAALSREDLHKIELLTGGHAARANRPSATPPSAGPAAPEPQQEADEDAWRNLALQFDGHRIEALGLLRYVADARNANEAIGRAGEIRPFLAKPPLPGEKVLAERIAALTRPQPVPSPVTEAGWRLVPVEPTEAMLLAAYDQATAQLLNGLGNAHCKTDEERSAHSIRPIYRAMLAAAPAQDKPE